MGTGSLLAPRDSRPEPTVKEGSADQGGVIPLFPVDLATFCRLQFASLLGASRSNYRIDRATTTVFPKPHKQMTTFPSGCPCSNPSGSAKY